MEYYNSYMNRQEISRETHEKLLDLEVPKRNGRHWAKYGALAACAALIVGVGAWKLAPRPQVQPEPAQSAGQFAADYTPLPGEKDVVEPDDLFVVTNSGVDGKLAFPMIPHLDYQDRTDSFETAASRAYAPGAFLVSLTKEDIQTIFWGPEGKPDAEHPKAEQSDLPWMLFWDGYTVHGRAWYDGQGQLTELTIYGEKGRASFELEMRLGALPFTCCIDLSRGDVLSEFNGVSVAGWSKVYDRDGDGEDDYICGSEFMTADDIGVRFVNRNSLMQAEYAEGESMELGGSKTFNSLFVRQALTGGLHLDHLMTSENIPAWREEEFAALAQARQEADFAPYLPQIAPISNAWEFYGRLSYQEGSQNMLFVRWSRGDDDVEIAVHRDGYRSYNLVDPAKPATYDLRLYSIPWCDSVPQEYRETINSPAFRVEDMSLEIVEARGLEKDTGGLRFRFDVLHPDGTLVSYRCDGMTARQVWELVEPTL